MPLARLQYRPGVDAERTASANRGGWSAVNLCRWREGTPESLLGWKRYVNQLMLGIARAIHWWEDLKANIWIAVGTTDRLYLVQGGDFLDISPINLQSTVGWTLDNFGQNLIACVVGQGIFAWAPVTPVVPAALIATAPIANGAFVAMAQQIVIAYGCSPLPGGGFGIDPLLIRWSDQSDYTNWTPSTTNQAGSFRLSRGSRIVGALQMPGFAVAWTDIDVWMGQFIGFPLVFGWTQALANCGLLGQHAMTILGDTAYWMSDHGFFRLGPQGVQQIPCSVWDIVYKNLDPNNQYKAVAGSDFHYSEVWFFFASMTRGTGEIDSYVKFNVAETIWDYGEATSGEANPMARTAWTDQNQPGFPLSTDLRGYLVQADQGFDADDVDLDGGFIQSGYQDLTEGRDLITVDQFIPDFRWDGPAPKVNITLYFRNYPGDEPTTIGPFPVIPSTEYVTLRVPQKVTFDSGASAVTFTAYPAPRAREVAIRIDTESGWWRLGACRLRQAPQGRIP